MTRSLLVVACALLVVGCGREPARPAADTTPEATVLVDATRGFTLKLPAGWTRATTELTPQISDPLEILTADVRREAWEILDSLRFDASVRPDWPASP